MKMFSQPYRCNTIPKIKGELRKHGFDYTVYGYEAEPSYLSFSMVSYWLGVVHQRFAPRFLHLSIFAFAQIWKDGT
jgi:hypothetical protein